MRIVKRARDEMTVCPMCGEQFNTKFGHNPKPLDIEGNVCDTCNITYVIPARLKAVGLSEDNKAEDEMVTRSEYAQKFNIGDMVRFKHPGQEFSEDVAEIIGFDDNGLYRIKWLDDSTESFGLGDANLVPEDAVEGNEDPYYDNQRHAFDSKESEFSWLCKHWPEDSEDNKQLTSKLRMLNLRKKVINGDAEITGSKKQVEKFMTWMGAGNRLSEIKAQDSKALDEDILGDDYIAFRYPAFFVIDYGNQKTATVIRLDKKNKFAYKSKLMFENQIDKAGHYPDKVSVPFTEEEKEKLTSSGYTLAEYKKAQDSKPEKVKIVIKRVKKK